MTRTRPLTLIIAAVAGVASAFALDSLLATRGLAVVVPPISLSVALVLIGVLLVALAWPVRRAAKGERRIDPFYALRVVVLAQASAVAAALLTGASAGILLYLVTRAVVPLGSSLAAGGSIVSAVLLVVAALVAEHWCALPPDDPTEEATP